MIKNNYATQVSQSSKTFVTNRDPKYTGNNYANLSAKYSKPNTINNYRSNNKSERLAKIDKMLETHARLQELFQKKYTPQNLQYSPSSKYFTKIHESRAVKTEHLDRSIETKAESIRVAKLW